LTSPTLSADGRLFAWWDTKVMRVWDTATSTLAGPELPAKNGALRTFSRAGDRLAVVGFDRGELKGRVLVWNYRTGQQIAVLRSDAANFAPSALSFSPDGRRLAACSEHLVIVWDVDTAQEIFTFRGHRGNVADVAFSSDGNHLASGGLDGIVRIWDVRPGDERPD
jgi:WD40 repeat protein